MLDMNLAKFVASDLPPFKSIVRDLFSGARSIQVDRGELREAAARKCKEFNLQPTEWFLDKVIQLYELILVRHGIMIIGDPMSCKTEAYHVLSEALTLLAREDKGEYRTTFKVINPKSITMDRLYGCFDPQTHEWTDGLVGRTFREMSTADTLAAAAATADGQQQQQQQGQQQQQVQQGQHQQQHYRRWLVFDGPVDPSWIDNLNTVLDDSKKLCLMNGEIIPLTK